jgi:spermidine/putrescine transport system permease protein
VVVIFSFNDSLLNAEWVGFTTRWYATLFADEQMLGAAANSLLIALTAATLATVLGTMAGIAMQRWRTGLLRCLPFLVLTPVAMPEILLGVSLLLFFRQVLDLTLGLDLDPDCAHHFLDRLRRDRRACRLAGLDESIFEAARDLGASPWQTFRRVTLPLILPGVLAGFLMSFTLSIDDFVITFFVAGVGVTTLPLQIYSMIKVAVSARSQCRLDAADGADADPDCAGREAGAGRAEGQGMRQLRAASAPCCLAVLTGDAAHAEDVLYLYIWNSYLSEDTVRRFEAQCQCR